jgi:GT2 family glycosyltransferase
MAKLDLSVIIVSYNTKKITKECIDSVNQSMSNSKIKYEIVVADNASKDGSHELLSKMAENKENHLVYFQTGENLGFGRGNNYAVKRSNGEYVLLLNSDTIVLNKSIEKLFNFYVENQKWVHFLGPKLLNRDLTPQASAARFFTLPVVFAALVLKGDYWGATRSSPDEFKKVDWVSGACILTSRKLYDRFHGFDKNIFMYMEEVDLLYRAAKKGFNTYFYPESQIIHFGSASS